MSTRALLSVALAPLFLGMGLMVALTAEMTVRRELHRGARETGAAAARSVAEFVTARDEEGRTWREPLERVLTFGQILEIRVSPCNDEPSTILAAPGSAGAPVLSPPSEEAVGALALNEAWTDVPEHPGRDPVVRAFAPLSGGGSVGVAASISPLVAHAARLRPRFLWATLGFTLTGVAAALLAGTWLVVGTRALETQAESLGTGVLADVPSPTGVRELDDLSSTFATMRSILEDSVAKGRRALLARPPSPTRRASLVGRPTSCRLEALVGEHRVTAHPVGPVPPGSFAGAVESPGGGCAFVGLTQGTDAADRAVEAEAARLFLEACLAGPGDPETWAADASDRFRLARLRLASWNVGDHVVRLLHTLPGRPERVLNDLEVLFAEPDQAAVGEAVAEAVPDLGPGLLMLIRPASPDPVHSTEIT